MKEERIEWIDIAKGIGIGCVVMGHIFSTQMLAHKIIYLFHMPLFFYISGFLYKKEQRNGAYIVKKFRNLIIPYFSVFVLVYAIFFLIYFPRDYSPDYIRTDITYYIMGGRLLREIIDNVFVAMWFITCLFIVQIVYNFIQTRFKPQIVHIIVLALLVAGYINSICFPYFWLYWGANIALMAIPIYHIGFLFRQINPDKYSIWFVVGGMLSFLSLLLFPQNTFNMMLNDYGIPVITLVCGIICINMVRVISVFITKSNILTRILSEFGKASLVIMAFHLPVYALLRKYFEMKSPPAIVLITIIPYLMYYLFNKFKVTQVLFLGKYSKKNLNKNSENR